MRTLLLLSLATALAVASPDNEPSARKEFYAANPSESMTAFVGTKTSLLVRTGEGNGNYKFREPSEDFEFHEGDRFRIRLQANASGYLYVVARDGQGSFRMLFPDSGGADASSRIQRFETRTIPEKDWFAFDANAGQERLYVFLSPKPLKEFEKLMSAPAKPVKNADLQKLVDRADAKSLDSLEESLRDGDVGATYSGAFLRWKNDPVLRRFRFRNYGK